MGTRSSFSKLRKKQRRGAIIIRRRTPTRRSFHNHPKDALAPGAAFQYAENLEKMGGYLSAADAYRVVVERYPNSPHFNDAIEAQFRIGEMYLNGKKIKLLGISIANSLDHAVEFSRPSFALRPMGNILRARSSISAVPVRKKERSWPPIQAYQAVVEKFPNSPVAPDAQYQIGYIWLVAAQRRNERLGCRRQRPHRFPGFSVSLSEQRESGAGPRQSRLA